MSEVKCKVLMSLSGAVDVLRVLAPRHLSGRLLSNRGGTRKPVFTFWKESIAAGSQNI